MTKPDSIFRFYKSTPENMEAIEKSYIYLFGAKQWKDASEMQFEVDTNDPVALKQFVTEEIERVLILDKQSPEYYAYFLQRQVLLQRHGRINMIGSGQEKDHLVELILQEIHSKQKLGDKKGLVRNNFFSKTGISCFTADETTIEDRFHWGAFAEAGEGFCVGYDWPLLAQYFADSNTDIRGDFVKYYEKDKPKLLLTSDYSEAVMANYCDIIFSLSQRVKDEKEFRFAKVYHEDMADKDDHRKQSIPASAIKTIILGPKMTPENQHKLLSIVKAKLPSTVVMKIDESSGTYRKAPFYS